MASLTMDIIPIQPMPDTTKPANLGTNECVSALLSEQPPFVGKPRLAALRAEESFLFALL